MFMRISSVFPLETVSQGIILSEWKRSGPCSKVFIQLADHIAFI